MRRLDRYVMREMLVPFIAGALIVALLFEANEYIGIAKDLNLDNVPILARVQWLVYTLPANLKLTFPTGVALASALSVGRMARESEVTAIRAAGAPVRRLMVPVVLFGLIAGILNFSIVDRLIPECGKKAREIAAKNVLLSLGASDKNFKANAFIQLGKYAATLGAVTRRPDDTLLIQDIMLIEHTGGGVASIVVAPSGDYNAGLWTFHGAHMYRVDGEDIVPVGADTLRIDSRADLNALMAANTSGIGANYEEMQTPDLQAAILTARKERSNPRPFEIEFHSRFAAGAACAVFAFTSAVFAVAFARSGGFAGLLVSFGVCVLYYNAYVISMEILGRQENVPTWVAAWLPNLIFGALGLVWVRRLE